MRILTFLLLIVFIYKLKKWKSRRFSGKCGCTETPASGVEGQERQERKGSIDLGGVLLAAVHAEGTEPCAPGLERRDDSISGGVVSHSRLPHNIHTYLHPCCCHSQPWHFLALGTTVTWHFVPLSLLFTFAVLQKKWNRNWLRKMDLCIVWPKSGKELILHCSCGNLIFYRS